MNISFIRTDKGLSVFTPEKTLSIASDDRRWEKALELLAQDDLDELVELLTPAVRLNRYVSESGQLEVRDGVLFYRGNPLPHNLHMVQRALQQSAEGFPVDPLLKFIENLMQNPSYRARQELLGFLEYGELPITPDGHFLAYKRVRNDYKDVFSGSIDNSIGQTVEMSRCDVDDDSNRTCSSGLHFCSREYLNNFSGARMVVLKIHPRDVVSIPVDYNNTKGRCCRYQVVGELTGEYDPTRGENAWDKSVVDDYDILSTPMEFQVGDDVRMAEDSEQMIEGEIVEIVDIDTTVASGTQYQIRDRYDDTEWVTAEKLERV